MRKEKLPVPKRIELVFDTLYLLTVLSLGGWLLAASSDGASLLWGVMALILGGGDACHLLPRMAAAVTGDTPKFQSAMGIGKLLTSVTMSLFYLLLWHGAVTVLSLQLPWQTGVVYFLAVARITLCVLPQNQWGNPNAKNRFGIYRNIPFFLQGGMVLWVFAWYAGGTPELRWMWLAILLSFAFYLPVVLFSRKYPKLGMLMLPKSCAYIWIVCMGLFL